MFTTMQAKNVQEERARERCQIRRVIGGLAYDTETASCLAWWDCTEYGPDMGEDLYVNVHGHYFLVRHDEDEITSNFAGRDADRWDQYLTLKPLTRAEAIAWTEKHHWRLVEELFGRMPEAGEGEPYQSLTC